MANCQIGLNAAVFEVLIRLPECATSYPIRSSDRHRGPTGRAGRTPFRCCRVRAGPASTADPQSRAQACAQPACRGSDHRRLVHPFHAPGTCLRSAIVLKPSTLLHLHSVLQQTKVPHVVFAQSAAVGLARRDRTKTSSTPSLQ